MAAEQDDQMGKCTFTGCECLGKRCEMYGFQEGDSCPLSAEWLMSFYKYLDKKQMNVDNSSKRSFFDM